MDNSGANDLDGISAAHDALAAAAQRVSEAVAATRGALRALELEPEAVGDEHPRELLDPLISRTRLLHAEARELGRRLGVTRSQLRRRLPDAPPASGERARPPTPDGRPATAAAQAVGPSAGVRVLIAQMTSEGRSRPEIERWLHDELGVGDAHEIVVRVLDRNA